MSKTLLTRRTVLQTAAASAAFAAPFARGVDAAARCVNRPNIMFDSMGAQVQVQNQTDDRLTTWTNALAPLYTVNYTDWQQPIAPQLQGQDVFIITTHHRTSVPANSSPPPLRPNPIPVNYNFSYSSSDLGGILSWVEAGGGLLLFVNHSNFPDQGSGPYWPIYDIQLAAALGITTVFAAIPLGGIRMNPNPDAPSRIIRHVRAVQAWDSGGIVVDGGASITTSTVLIPLPAGWHDSGPLKYENVNLAFAVLYSVGAGRVIVVGHSGITGNVNTNWPSLGQIEASSNFRFLMNCVAYLAQCPNG
jgi:hypothetical protein